MDKLFVAYEEAKENTINGDFIDKLHSKITVLILFVISILIGIKQFEETQIFCWLPHQLSDEQADYTHQLCWVNNTYYYPDVVDADLFPESNQHTVLYYQYILFIVLGQALMFYLPTMIWNVLSRNSIGYIKKLLDQTQKSNVVNKIKTLAEMKQEEVSPKSNGAPTSVVHTIRSVQGTRDTGDELDTFLLDKEFSEEVINKFKSIVSQENQGERTEIYDNKTSKNVENVNENENHQDNEDNSNNDYSKKEVHSKWTLKNPFKKINSEKSKVLSFMKPTAGVEHLTWHYMFLKILNLINVVIQMILLNYMFGGRFLTYGIDFFVSLMNNENPFFLTTQFPIITFCDFLVYQNLRKIHYNAAQCILPINVLIEKFFLLVWFWYYLLIILTLINILSWSIELLPVRKLSFFKKYLTIRTSMEKSRRQRLLPRAFSISDDDDNVKNSFTDKDVENFYHEYFGSDGFIMLHMIKSVAGDIIFMDLFGLLWKDFKKNKNLKSKGKIKLTRLI